MTTQNIIQQRRIITLDLIRKRSEHNEGLVSNLEEIALHQEELEAIGPTLGRTCGRTLKILLLQNNVISKMYPYDFRPMKMLEYLNLALNNITKVEGISQCEFLYKIDLTLNFIDLDTLQESLENMKNLRSLRELYIIGNPCVCEESTAQNQENHSANEVNGWKGARMYVIAKLPQLQILDGKEILKSVRIQCAQRLPELQKELDYLATITKSRKEETIRMKRNNLNSNSNYNNASFEDTDNNDDNRMTEHTPEERLQISHEMAKQKKDKEDKQRLDQPHVKGEKEHRIDQIEKVHQTRQIEKEVETAINDDTNGRIKQCNEGKLKFSFNEDKKPGFLLLDIHIQKYLSSSLIDVDMHPEYVSIVIKSKILRLKLPVEVKSSESIAQRSTTSGNLLLIMPKVNPKTLNFITSAATTITKRTTNSNKSLTSDMIRYADICLDKDSLSQYHIDSSSSELKEVCTKRNKNDAFKKESDNAYDSLDEPPPLQ